MTQNERPPTTLYSPTARALVRAHPTTCSEPLIGWLKITHVLSPTFKVRRP